jgi:hypothetical protein
MLAAVRPLDLLAPCQARGHYFPNFRKLQTIAIALQKRRNASTRGRHRAPAH